MAKSLTSQGLTLGDTTMVNIVNLGGGSTFDLYVGKLDITFTQISAVNYTESNISEDWSVTLPDMEVGTVRAVNYNLATEPSPPLDKERVFGVKIYLPSQGRYFKSSSKIEKASMVSSVTNDSVESSQLNAISGGSILLDDFVMAKLNYIQGAPAPINKTVQGTFYVARFS
jgi:hypothetical protein